MLRVWAGKKALIEAGKSDKTINNVLAVLSKVLKYAEAARVITHAPSVGLLKAEGPEIIALEPGGVRQASGGCSGDRSAAVRGGVPRGRGRSADR